jgi:hypothetical protein
MHRVCRSSKEISNFKFQSRRARGSKFGGRKFFETWILWLGIFFPFAALAANTNVHTSWLWHLHQPIYWPDRRNYGTDHYENAWDTIQQQNAGRAHPSPEILSQIFGLSDRVNAYQAQPKTTVGYLLGYPNAGAQVSYSGALIENVQSLAIANQLGYTSGWNNNFQTARGWTTSGGKPRLDLVNFTYHHALAPLLSDETLEMELRIQRRQMEIFWNTNIAALSRGYFPAETCFSERMIPILKKVGIDWSVVANTHLARACADFPVVTGSGGEMCDLPNLADQLNPAQGAGNYQRTSIDRGCSPTQVMPFGFQLHYARYVDPNSGGESKIIVVPADQVFGWKDSYSTWDLNLIAPIAARNNPAKPSLVFCAHDGDNAWSGGSSYYNEWVPNMASTAANDGYEPTTVQQFISDFPPDTNDVVHVEDGGWVFADGDFGSPIFINWHWPPGYSTSSGYVVDPSSGTSDKADNWRVILATENRVKTAQQISGITPNIDQVRDPGSFSGTPNAVELGWHYYLASLDSGFVYYGCHDDECQRSVVAQSNAVRNVNSILAANPSADATPPTIFPPQRHPWNPGGTNFGNQYGYKLTVATNSDFWVWTYAYDVSGVTNVSLLLRINGTNPPASDQFKTYAGGPLTGAWQTSNMIRRVVAPVIGVTPQYIADYFFAKVSGISNAFVDYYVSAADARGNIFKSPIQHVWVGNGSGASSGGGNSGSAVSVSPAPPVAGNSVMIQYDATGRVLASASQIYIHLGWNNWNTVVSPDPAMTFNSQSNWWQFTTAVPANATNLNCVFNNGSGTWDNNGGANWNFSVTNSFTQTTNYPPFQMDGAFDSTGYLLTNSGMVLYAAVRGTTLYVATWSPGTSGPNDHFIFVSDQLLPSASASAPWAKAGNLAVATSKPFLASESQNSYVSWFVNGASVNWPCAKSATNSGAMEGTLDLVQAFGTVPTNIFLCAAAYVTTNGGSLVAQCPAGSGPDIETNEFFVIPVAALRDLNADGIFDQLDPNLDFKFLNAQRIGNNCALTWAAMPGRSYQIIYTDSLNDSWQDLIGASNDCAPTQIFLSWTDTPLQTITQRFYRVKLLP